MGRLSRLEGGEVDESLASIVISENGRDRRDALARLARNQQIVHESLEPGEAVVAIAATKNLRDMILVITNRRLLEFREGSQYGYVFDQQDVGQTRISKTVHGSYIVSIETRESMRYPDGDERRSDLRNHLQIRLAGPRVAEKISQIVDAMNSLTRDDSTR